MSSGLSINWNKPGKKKKITHMTMMVIPHNQGNPVKNVCLPMWAIRTFLFFSVVCMLIVGYFVTGFFYLKYLADENKELKEVNMAQAQEISELKGLAGSMSNKLDALIKLDHEVREKVGLTKSLKDEKKSREAESSRGAERYQLMTMGLNQKEDSVLIQNKAMIPYLTEAEEDLLSETFEGVEGVEEKILELPFPEGEKDTLVELKEELNNMDGMLTQQAEAMNKLKSDVEKQIAFQKAIPNGWPVRGRITSGFGWRKNPFSHNGSEFHKGVDLASSYGVPIRAAGGGVVTFAGYKSSWGKVVIISHGYGYVTQYAHNSSILVRKGQKVERGQIITRMGRTGRATGTHLHFGVAKNGNWINPLQVLKH